MIDLYKLFQLIGVAVATGVFAHFVTQLRERHLKIERFKYHCDSRFNYSVRYNENLPPQTKELLMAAYQESRIPYMILLFSARPLNPVNWYNQEQLDAFFN